MKCGMIQLLRLAGGVVVLWLTARFALPLVLPFLMGLALALAAEPMVGFLCRRSVPRGVSTGIGVTMAFCFLALAVLLLGALVVGQLRMLAGILPDLESAAQTGIGQLQRWLLTLTDRAPGRLGPMLRENVTGLFSDGNALLAQGGRFLLGLAGGVLSRVPDSALTLGTGLISAYLISAKLPALRDWVRRQLPWERLARLLMGLKRLREAVGGWLMAQLTLMGVTLALLLAGFWLLRIPYGPVWALVVALVDALPVLGTGTVLLPWAALWLIRGEAARAIGMAGLYLTITLVRSMLEPRLLGRRLGLDPLVTLIAMYAGYKLWGIGGMLLAPLLTVTATQLPTPRGME